MKITKQINLGLSIGLITAFLSPNQAALAYNVTINSKGNLTLTGKLEKYEKKALLQIANAVGFFDLNKNAGFNLTLSNQGKIEELKFLAPKPDKTIQSKIVNKLNSISFGTIPGFNQGSTLNLEVELKELRAKSFNREKFRSMGSSKLVVAGNITIGGSSIRTEKLKSNKKKVKAPYTKSDKEFEKEVSDLYKEYGIKMVLNNRYSRKTGGMKSSTLLENAEIKEDAKLWYPASILYASLAKKYIKEGELTKAKDSLKKALELSNKLTRKQRSSLGLILISSSSSIYGSQAKEQKMLFLNSAQKLINNYNINDPYLNLAFKKASNRMSIRTSSIEAQIEDQKAILSLSKQQKPISPNAVSNEYIRLIDLLIKADKTKEAETFVSQALNFHESTYGQNNIILVKILLKHIELAKSKSEVKNDISKMNELISNYVPSPVRLNLLVPRRATGVDAQRSLLRYVKQKTMRRGNGLNDLDLFKTINIAKLSYKLSIKNTGFDRSSFGTLVTILKSENKQDLLDSLYNSTIKYLEKSGTESDRLNSQSLKSSYLQFLKSSGNKAKAKELEQSINETISQRSATKKEKDKQELAKIESFNTPDCRKLVLAKLKMIRWFIKDKDLNSIKTNFGDVAKLLESNKHIFDRMPQIQRPITFAIRNVSEIDGVEELSPQIKRLVNLVESKSQRGFSNATFLINSRSSSNKKFKANLSDWIYKAKKKRFAEDKSVETYWMSDLVCLAVQNKNFNDAIKYQKKYIERVRTMNSASSELIASEKFKLAQYYLLAKNNFQAVNSLNQGMEQLTKTPHSANLKRLVGATLIPLSQAFSEAKLLDQARKSLKIGIENAKSLQHFRTLGLYQKALDALVSEYKLANRLDDAETLLEFVVKQAKGRNVDSAQLYLANFQLEASVAQSKKKTKWLSKSNKTFEALIERIQSKQGKESSSYKKAVRCWVEKLESSGYSKQAKLVENRLKN